MKEELCKMCFTPLESNYEIEMEHCEECMSSASYQYDKELEEKGE